MPFVMFLLYIITVEIRHNMHESTLWLTLYNYSSSSAMETLVMAQSSTSCIICCGSSILLFCNSGKHFYSTRLKFSELFWMTHSFIGGCKGRLRGLLFDFMHLWPWDWKHMNPKHCVLSVDFIHVVYVAVILV